MLNQPMPGGRPRRWPTILMWTVGALVAVLLMAFLYDKGFSLLPGAQRLPGYVVNRDGHYYAGTRCENTPLREIGVFFPDWIEQGGSLGMEGALWWAEASPPGVEEFELFAPSQAGVRVLADTGVRPWMDEIAVSPRDAGGSMHGTRVTLAELSSGQVKTAQGVMDWNRFMRMSPSIFGCVTLPRAS